MISCYYNRFSKNDAGKFIFTFKNSIIPHLETKNGFMYLGAGSSPLVFA